MKVDRLDIVDWEPCRLTFDFGREGAPFEALRQFIETWLKERETMGICSCSYRYSDYSKVSTENSVRLETEWACEVCAQALADAVKEKFSALREVRLGLEGSPVKPQGPPFIQVEQKEVEFEVGTRVAVAPFLIARHPVSIGEFETFVADTGHVTVAEQEDEDQTFRQHCGLSGLAKSQRLMVPATFLAPIDAEAYCRHVGCRLPTEAEWLAAAVLEWKEVELTSLERLRRQRLPLPANAIHSTDCWDITATQLDARVVARRGPMHYLRKGWRTERVTNSRRRLIGPNDFDISVTFRVAKDLPVST